MKRTVPGINIQFPISQLIVTGEKTIETRTYRLPDKYIGVPIALIETPGKTGKFKARITAVIKFGPSFRYDSQAEFYADFAKHKVSRDSEWKWKTGSYKHGWPVQVIETFKQPKRAPQRRGIVFTTQCTVIGAD